MILICIDCRSPLSVFLFLFIQIFAFDIVLLWVIFFEPAERFLDVFFEVMSILGLGIEQLSSFKPVHELLLLILLDLIFIKVMVFVSEFLSLRKSVLGLIFK